MAFGHWNTLRAEIKSVKLLKFAILFIAIQAINTPAKSQIVAQNELKNSYQNCSTPLYLTFDTGHMEVAPLIADVLNKHQVKVTFFGANERTKVGNGSLSQHWAPWWKARAAEGHEFASHTYDHVYWRGDLPNTAAGVAQFRIKPSAGAFEGREFTYDAKKYCEQIAFAAERLQDFTGKKPLPLYRAPGGKTSPKLLAVAKSCGFEHVGWSPAGFLGDELPSGAYPNAVLLKKALNNIKSGDILLAHLGIWSRQDPWAPAVLEPLIVGLKAKGFCFQTLREHPQYKGFVAATK
jgi:peptidoglycan/xylan/chitin deacetylase (PgdA/CDA1 family)